MNFPKKNSNIQFYSLSNFLSSGTIQKNQRNRLGENYKSVKFGPKIYPFTPFSA